MSVVGADGVQQTAQTDADGGFAVTGVPRGDASVGIATHGPPPFRLRPGESGIRVTVRSGTTRLDVDLDDHPAVVPPPRKKPAK